MTEKNRTGKLLCAFISTFLAFCIGFVSIAPIIAKAANSKIYVADIKIYECEDEDNSSAEAKKWFEDNGYVFTGINLNQGTDTDESAYLGYKPTTNKDMAITDIRMMAMDTGYTIYNYEDMMNYLASQKAGTAQTLQNAAVTFAANYRAGSPKAIDAYEGLNLFHVGDEAKTKLGDYILAGKTDVRFFTEMIMKSSTGTINAVHGFLSTGIAPYQNDLNENGETVTTNWAQFTVRSELWNTIDSDSLTTDQLNELHKNYNDAARELFRTIQDFVVYYENAAARRSEASDLPEAQTMEQAAEAMEEVEREDSDFLYLAAFGMLNEYEFSDGTRLGDWFVQLGKTNSDNVDLTRLYPVVEAMGKCQAAVASSGGFVSAVLNLAENERNDVFEDAVNEAKDKIIDLTNEESFSIWENCDGDIENSTIAFTSDAVRKSTAENALGRKSNWEKKKETIEEIEKVVNLAMGAAFVVIPVLTFVLSMTVLVTKMMAATCIAVAALNTMCVWMLSVISFLNACLPYVSMLILIATITATVTIWAKEYIMGDKVHIDKQSEKPDLIFDAQEKMNETLDIKYKSVRNNRGEVSDINCGCQIYWCLLAYTTDENAGSPLCADEAGNIFIGATGNATSLAGYDCVKFFGERSAANCNAYCKKDEDGGVYVYYRTEASIPEGKLPPEDEQASDQAEPEERNYIADLIVCTGKDAAEARAKITRHSGKYYILDQNLSPDCKQATYIGYTMTTDRTAAITDLRVAPYAGVSQQSNIIMLGDVKYTRIDILGTFIAYGDETTKPQTDCLYYTSDPNAGEPILADGLHVVTKFADAKPGWEPVTLFSGGVPYNFNTGMYTYKNPYDMFSWSSEDRTNITSVVSYLSKTDHGLNGVSSVYVYYETDKPYTEGTKYLSGLFFVGGYDWDDYAMLSGDIVEYVDSYKEKLRGLGNLTISDVNLAYSLCQESWCGWGNIQVYVGYTWSYNPKRALYNIEVYQGDNYSNSLAYTMAKANDSGISQNYVSASFFCQQSPDAVCNVRFVHPANTYMNSAGIAVSKNNLSGYVTDGSTHVLPENITFGYNRSNFLPTGLYVTGYQQGQRPLTLEDVVFSTNAYQAAENGGRLSVELPGESTLGGNTPVGAFHGVTEMKNPRSVRPFNLSYPDFYDDDDDLRCGGNSFYIYVSGTKLAKRKYISGLSVGAFSREQYKETNSKASNDELKAVDAIVNGTAMSAAASACSDEVIVYNLATDKQGDAWYNRQKDGKALRDAPENTPAAYIGVNRTDVGTASDDGVSSKQRPITGVLLYRLDDSTSPGVLEIDSVKYYCAGVSTPIMMNGVKYFLYYSYSKGAFPGEPVEELVLDNIPIIADHATNVCADISSTVPYGNADQTSFIHLKYEPDKNNDFFNNIYIGQGRTEREAKCDLLTHGCLEFLDMDANTGVTGHSVYVGFRRGHLDTDKINSKRTESARANELKKQLQEAVYDIIITNDEPYYEDGMVRNNIYYRPAGKADLTGGMGHRLYMYYASPWYSSRYNTNTGASTLLPQDVFTGYLTQLAMSQYDRVPYNNSLAGTVDTQNSVKPWEYVLLSDNSRAADLNEGTVAFKSEGDTARYAYDNRITMFVQRSDGSVKPAGEITGGFVEKNMTVGSAYYKPGGAAYGASGGWRGSNFTGGTIALAVVPAIALCAIVFALAYRKKKKESAA